MHGLINKITAAPGQRDALIALILEASASVPGCLSYVVARDGADADAVWITEVWDSAASHKASLDLPAVKDAIGRAMPLVTGFESTAITVPAGGVGLIAPNHPLG